MKATTYILSIICLISLLSCEKDIEFSGEITKPELVINSLIFPDTTVSIKVSKSRFFLDDDSKPFETVNNAKVKLYINDVFKEELISKGAGIYESLYKPDAGDKIKVEVKVDGYELAESEVEIPDYINITKIDTNIINLKKEPIINGGYYNQYGEYLEGDTVGYYYNREINFSLNFEDIKDKENYYRLAIYSRDYYNGARDSMDNYLYFDFYDIVSGNRSTGDEDILGEITETSNRYNVFSDELFDGKTYPLKFKINTYSYEYLNGYNQGSKTSSKIIINLQAISKSYYLYLKTVAADPGDMNFFSEPVQIHSNVKGGIGVVGSCTKNIKSITFSN